MPAGAGLAEFLHLEAARPLRGVGRDGYESIGLELFIADAHLFIKRAVRRDAVEPADEVAIRRDERNGVFPFDGEDVYSLPHLELHNHPFVNRASHSVYIYSTPTPRLCI